MAGEIQLNGTSFASESAGTITVNNATLSNTVIMPSNTLKLVASKIKTDAASNGTTYSEITDLTITITNPASSSSKFWCQYNLVVGHTDYDPVIHGLFRTISGQPEEQLGKNDTTDNSVFDHNSTMLYGLKGSSGNLVYLDQPATTSSITYKVKYKSSTGTVYLNSNTGTTKNVSSFVIFEVL